MRYCKIANCEYFRGTSDKNIHMFRTPVDQNWAEQWRNVLKNIKCSISSNLICFKHFQASDYSKKNSGKIYLNRFALPSIFHVVDGSTIETNDTFEVNDPLVNNKVQADEFGDSQLVKEIENLKESINKLNLQNEAVLNQTIQSQSEKIQHLTDELNSLKTAMKCELIQFALNAREPKALRQKEIITCLAVGVRNRNRYCESVRNFCIGLNNTSPAAYRFMRNEFDNRIPTPGTIRSWYSNSNIDCKPGIIDYSLGVLKRKVDERAAKGGKLIGGLLFDEMAIHRLLQWADKKMIGYETIPGANPKDTQIANEALVFMFTGFNEILHLPVAYYFSNKVDSVIKSELVKNIIKSIIDCGVVLKSITFDGFRTNPMVCRIFGADLDVFSDTFDPSFIINNCQITAVFDPSHVMKLVRGSLSSKKVFYDSHGHQIKWKYFEDLVRFKYERNFGSMHKMTSAHIGWRTDPMNVKLAVQTLSASTANAIEFLMNQGHSEFVGAEHTIKFIRVINNIFDVFNSTDTSNSNQNILKRPMNPSNIREIIDLFEISIDYIKGLQCSLESNRRIPLCNSTIKTGFQGCVVNMRSFITIYNDLVSEKKLMNHIPTKNLSQDHLEIFFGKMRALGGSNTNPTCQQFTGGMRKLLNNTTQYYSRKGNCTESSDSTSVYNPYSNILCVTSRRPKDICVLNSNDFTDEDTEVILQELDMIRKASVVNSLIDMTDITIAHIASIIESHIENSSKFLCGLCKNVFSQNDKVHKAFQSQNHTKKACQSTFDICRTADYFLKLEILKGQFSFKLIHHTIFSSLVLDNLYPSSEWLGHEDHKPELIKHILGEYIGIKGRHIARTVSFNEKDSKAQRKRLHFV